MVTLLLILLGFYVALKVRKLYRWLAGPSCCCRRRR